MSTFDDFNKIWDRVRTSKEWADMESTVEGTHWHREANVAVHTKMTIDHYMANFYPYRSEGSQMLSLMALLFHDFGKPPTESTNAEGRHQYLGHEPVSGDMMLEFMARNNDVRALFFASGFYGYDSADLEAIKFIIDNHLPYGMRVPKKVQALKDKIEVHLGRDSEAFFDVLMSDTCGRIMDNREERIKSVEDWIAGFKAAPKWVDTNSPEARAARKAEWQAKNAA